MALKSHKSSLSTSCCMRLRALVLCSGSWHYCCSPVHTKNILQALRLLYSTSACHGNRECNEFGLENAPTLGFPPPPRFLLKHLSSHCVFSTKEANVCECSRLEVGSISVTFIVWESETVGTQIIPKRYRCALVTH